MQKTNIPLQALIHRLQLAGFNITPGERLRLLRMLHGPAKAYLTQPEKLKYLLCPLIAHNEADQLRFYDIFDRYIAEIMEVPEEETADTPSPWYTQIPRWGWIIAALLLITLGGWGLKQLLTKESIAPISVSFNMPETVRLGDTLAIRNTSTLDSTRAEYHWMVLNAGDKEHPLHDAGKEYHCRILIDEKFTKKDLQLRLEARLLGEDSLYTFEQPFPTVLCANPPPEVTIIAPEQVKVGQEVDFEAKAADLSAYKLRWIFSGDTIEGGVSVKHSFSKAGRYTVRLIVSDENADGVCSRMASRDILIGGEKAYVALIPVEKDSITPYAGFNWWLVALLLGLLGAAVIFYLAKWIWRKAPEPEKEKIPAALKAFKAADRSPYFIPFENKQRWVLPDGERHYFAQALRLRNIGQVAYMDVPKTIEATVEGGGFPSIRFGYKTQPTDYLFLIEDQAQFSHQTALFRYLVEFLMEQEVVADLFYYDKDFHRFWNANYPQGIDLDTLRQGFPAHRLIIFGDGHGLIDAFAEGEERLNPALLQTIEKWSLRLLFTPHPPRSWTWREYLLFNHFMLFPSDADGLASAAAHLSNGHERADLEQQYKRWKAQLEKERHEPDTNYRSWRRYADHEQYFEGRPDMLRWLTALSVWPNPTWETTIAIGKALEGVAVTYDNLLLLARIPWLQEGHLHPGLRREMLKALSKADEQAARRAIHIELTAVRELTKNSHVATEMEVGIAIQEFALAPEATDKKEAIRYLMEQGVLTKKQIKELDIIVGQIPAAVTGNIFKASDTGIVEYLREPDKQEATPQRPFWTADLIKAILLSGLWLLLFVFFWQLEGSEQLYRWAFGHEAVEFPDNRPLERRFGIIREKVYVDSAVIYNNLGVGIWNLMKRQYLPAEGKPVQYDPGLLRVTTRNFENALRLRPDYQLADRNLGAVNYNTAAIAYNRLLASNNYTPEVLRKLMPAFRTAANHLPTASDGRHGLGLLAYYSGDIPTAKTYRDTLLSTGFFDTLSSRPHLADLLQSIAVTQQPRLLTITPKGAATGNDLSVQIHYLLPDGWQQPLTASLQISTSGRIPKGLRIPTKRISAQSESATFTLHYTPDTEVTTDSITAVLRDATQSYNSLTIAYKHRWQPRPPSGEESIPPTADLQVLGTVRYQKGTPVANATITLTEDLQTPEARSPFTATTTSDFEGSFGVTIPAQAAASDYLLSVKAPDCDELNTRKTPTDLQDLLTLTVSCTPTDTDQDGIPDPTDNCPNTPNPDQADFDQDGKGDACDPDMDNDGIPNATDQCPNTPTGTEVDDTGCEKPPTTTPDAAAIIARLEKNMVRVQGGQFMMGSNKGDTDEKPPHEVIVSDYQIGKYEVTQAQWRAVMGSDPEELWNTGCDECPVDDVSWNDIQQFLKKLNKLTGKKYRLPTEAEWEYAARGGQKSKGYKYAGSNDIDKVAWYDDNYKNGKTYGSRGTTHPVGTKQPNELGLYDMSGNVWEWCNDRYGKNYYQECADKGVVRNPQGPGKGSYRVSRGGGWYDGARYCRSASRDYGSPTSRYSIVGFRLAHSL